MQGFRFTSPLPVFWCTFSALYIKSYYYLKIKTAMKKETWKLILQLILSIITAIATTLGVTSCIS